MRWAAWLALGGLILFLIGDTILRKASLASITGIKTSDVPVESTRLSPGARVHSEILSVDSYDGRWWVLHATEMLRGQTLRIRDTRLDNAPRGREVHWSSSITWLLGLTATVIAAVQSKAPVNCVTEAAFWAGPIHLVLCLILLGWLAARRFGTALALLFAAIFTLSPLVYQCFRAGLIDHHGLVCAFAVGSVLCLVAGGAGMVRPPGKKQDQSGFVVFPMAKARWWFLWSGVLGGAALWVSAASFIPILVGCGGGAFAALALRDRATTIPAPELWRAWGQAGCITSLAFYALEYFPAHMGWRLEVNHPLFALAWLGAGDLLARLVAAFSGQPVFARGRSSRVAAVASLVAVILPPALMVLRPQEFFWVSDKFLLLLHNQFIQEFQSLPHLLAQTPTVDVLLETFTWPVFVVTGAAYLLIRRIAPRGWHSLLAFALVPTLTMQALGLMQIRWLILSAGLWALYALLVLAAYADRDRSSSQVIRVAFGLAGLITLSGTPFLSALALSQLQAVIATPPKAAIPAILARDIAHRLVQSSPQRLPVVLAGPTTSTDLNYFAGIRTIGTLYWENLPGLKRAAHIFAAPDEARARTLITEAGVTHIIVSTWDNFGTAYVELLREAELDVPAPGQSFIEKLWRENQPPDWLRPLYYPIPDGFGIQEELRLYAVMPEQTPAQARMHRGIYALDAQDFTSAEKLFSEALALDPVNPDLPNLLSETRHLRGTPPPPSTPNVSPPPP